MMPASVHPVRRSADFMKILRNELPGFRENAWENPTKGADAQGSVADDFILAPAHEEAGERETGEYPPAIWEEGAAFAVFKDASVRG